MPRGRHRTKVIQLNRINGNFGLKIVGGSDLKVPPSVAELQPGGAAEYSQKIGVGDLLLSINGKNVHTYSQADVSKALLNSPDSCQFIFQTNIYIRESVLEIISLRYMLKFKKGECDIPLNTVNFHDGELCPSFEINSVSRPLNKPSPPSLSKPSPPPSLSSTNGTTTADSCTESTCSETTAEVHHATSHTELPLSQRRIPTTAGTQMTSANPSDADIPHLGSLYVQDRRDSPSLELYEKRPGSLADLLERDRYSGRPQPLSESDGNTDFGSHPNISYSSSWHRLNNESKGNTQQEMLFCSKYGSIYCESLEDSLDDDLNSLCSDYSRSTSVVSNSSSLLSNRESTKFDVMILRKDRSLSSLSLDTRLDHNRTLGAPNSDHGIQKTTHLHTTSDIGQDNYFGSDLKYGSLPPAIRKRNREKQTNTSKLSAPVSRSFKVDKANVQFEMNQEEMSEMQRKARNMYRLENYSDQEVCQLLAPNTSEATELGVLYSSFFDFTELNIVDAFRDYLRHLKLEGESQEQDRIVEFFSNRYYKNNELKFDSSDAVHVLVCSLLLLNADLHGQNLAKPMSYRDFYDNLVGQCNGKNFPTHILKDCYTSIKKKALETGSKGLLTATVLSVASQEETGEVPINIENSMVTVNVNANSKPIREGPLYIKNITDTEGKRTAGKQRQWRLYYSHIRGPLLVLWSMSDTKRSLSRYRKVYPLTHSLARPCPEYTKRNHALRVHTCQRQVILIDARDLLDMQGWVSAVNLSAALHSSPPMAGALGVSTTFSRPTIPIGSSMLEKLQQIEFLEKTIVELENDLEKYSPENFPLEHLKTKPKNWVKDMLDYRNFLASEVHRYRVYTGCIDLNDKDNLFQQKPVYYLSRLLQKEFEPIIETPESS